MEGAIKNGIDSVVAECSGAGANAPPTIFIIHEAFLLLKISRSGMIVLPLRSRLQEVRATEVAQSHGF
jgi:hypothetical protein